MGLEDLARLSEPVKDKIEFQSIVSVIGIAVLENKVEELSAFLQYFAAKQIVIGGLLDKAKQNN